MKNKQEMNYYWSEKETMAKTAKTHSAKMRNMFYFEIEESVNNSLIFDSSTEWTKPNSVNKNDTVITVENTDTVSAIKEQSELCENSKIVALNFASYKHPGGAFMDGSRAQEECLCHESTLYNVISDVKFEDYYKWNNEHKNKALYLDRAIYSPNIIFREEYRCDVLTCAAPNYAAAYKYNTITKETNQIHLERRCWFVLNCCAQCNADVLILGAFGCGVFGQDASNVASVFKKLLNTEFKNVFKKVVFAVPQSSNNNNYQLFVDVFLK